jgi:hypothetical protein
VLKVPGRKAPQARLAVRQAQGHCRTICCIGLSLTLRDAVPVVAPRTPNRGCNGGAFLGGALAELTDAF